MVRFSFCFHSEKFWNVGHTTREAEGKFLNSLQTEQPTYRTYGNQQGSYVGLLLVTASELKL